MEEQIKLIIKELNADVQKALEETARELAKEGVERLKRTSPKRTGKYAKGWTSKKQDDAIIIHTKNKPGLTHLLEKGHAKRNGGRTKPIKHIEPVEEYLKKEMERRVEEKLK